MNGLPLDAIALEHYRRDGYHILRGAVSPRERDELRGCFRDALSRLGEDALSTEHDAGGNTIFEKLHVPVAELPRDAVASLVTPGRALAARLLEVDPAQLDVLPVFIRKPGGASRTYWHQHSANTRPAHLGEDVTLWMGMDAADDANGCIQVVPGSHRGPVLPIDERVYVDDALIAPDTVVACPTAAGDVVVLHQNLVHGAAANPTSSDRLAFTLYCVVRIDA